MLALEKEAEAEAAKLAKEKFEKAAAEAKEKARQQKL